MAGNPFDQYDDPASAPAPAPAQDITPIAPVVAQSGNPFDQYDQQQAVSRQAQDKGGFWRNVGAGVEQIPGMLENMIANSNPDAMPFQTRDAANAGQGLTRRIANTTGLDPNKVAQTNFTDALGRNLGQNGPLLAIPGEGELTAANMGRQLLTGAGSVFGQTAAQQVSDNPLVQAGGALIGGGATGLVTQIPGAIRRAGVRMNMTPEQEGAAYVAKTMGAAGSTPDQLEAWGPANYDKPATSAEAIGRPGVTALTTLSRRAGTTPDTLATQLAERAQGTSGRVIDNFIKATGVDPDAALGNMETIVNQGRKNAKPLYEAALDAPPATDDRLARFAQDPDVRKMMQKGIRIQRLQALADGEDFAPNMYAVTGFNEAGDAIIGPVPNWRTWNAAKVGFDNTLEGFRDPVTKKLNFSDPEVHAVDAVRRSMLNELDGLNPAYGKARAVAGDYLSANDAFTTAQKMMTNPNVTTKQIASKFQSLNPADAEAFKGGIANWTFNKSQAGNLTGNLFAKNLAGSKYIPTMAGRKMQAVFGPERGAAFLGKMNAESSLTKTGSRMAPGTNSTTFETTDAAKDMDTIGAAKSGLYAVGNAARGKLGLAGAHAVSAAQQLGAFAATPTMGMASRDVAGRLLMMPPEELAPYMRDYSATTAAQELANRPPFPARGLAPAVTPFLNNQNQPQYRRGGMI